MFNYTNRLKLDKDNPTPLNFLKGKNVVAVKIDVDSPKPPNLPGNLAVVDISFFNAGNPNKEQLLFTRKGYQRQVFPVDTSFKLDYDFCEVTEITPGIEDNENLYLYFYPPVETSI